MADLGGASSEPPPIDYREYFRRPILDLAADAEIQRQIDFPPHEFWIGWMESYLLIDPACTRSNPVAVASFSPLELVALADFNALIAALPDEPDKMWSRASLDNEPWPEIRRTARALLDLFDEAAGEPPLRP
jgi:hypothetical protein